MDSSREQEMFDQLTRIEAAIAKLSRKRVPKVPPKPAPVKTPSGMKKYGRNTFLKEVDMQKLVNLLGAEKAMAAILHFDAIKAEKGYIYKNDYIPIIKWGIRAYEEFGVALNKVGVAESGAVADANEQERRWREKQ